MELAWVLAPLDSASGGNEGVSDREYMGMADSLYRSSMRETTPKDRDGLAGISDEAVEDMTAV